MHNPLLIAILAGLGGMIGWGSADFFAKNAIDKIGPIKSLVWSYFFGSIFIAFALLVQQIGFKGGAVLPHDGLAWLGLAGFGILQVIIYWLAYMAFEKGKLSILNPIFASFTGIVALVSILFFGEHVNAVIIIALLAIFAGVILVNVDPRDLRTKKLPTPGLLEISAATILAAVWTLGWDRFVAGQDPLSYTFWTYLFMTLASIGLAFLLRQKPIGIPRDTWKFLVLMGCGEGLAYAAVTWGYSSTDLTGIVALTSGAFSIPAVVLAYVFLKERVTKLQAAAIGIIIAGIVLVSAS